MAGSAEYTIVVRQLQDIRPDEWQAIKAMRDEQLDGPQGWPLQEAPNIHDMVEGSRFVLAYDGAELVGSGRVQPHEDTTGGYSNCWEIGRLVSRYPGRGTGSAMLNKLEETIAHDGAIGAILYATPDTPAGSAEKFYENHGYRKTDRLIGYAGKCCAEMYKKLDNDET